MTNDYNISDEEVTSLTQAILKRHGIDFTCYEPKSLKRRIVRAISVFQMNGIHDLWMRVLKEPDFMQKFMNELSVGLTSMFRDPILWKTLKSQLPKVLENQNSLSVWHAGCSTGEEVFSMGILLRETGLAHKASALATDMNLDAISQAKSGLYHKIKMLEFEKNYKEYNPFGKFDQYFVRDENNAQFHRELIQHVKFKYQNLINDPFPGQFDVIFCRNVMIYFDNGAKIKLLKKFHESLKPGGIFIVGFYDAINALVDESLFELLDSDSKIFRAKHPALAMSA